MSLTIARTDDPAVLRWAIAYETGGRDVRNYELVSTDAAGRYVIDEKNGLFLDAAYSDGVLYSPFTIGSQLITASYRVESDGAMRVDMPSFGAEPVRTSCLEGQAETCASSFGLSGTQHCRLVRQQMRRLGD